MSIKPNWYTSCSPRSPEKILPEIKELAKYDNTLWVGNNSESQKNFATDLANLEDFKGETFDSEKSFSARDRVAPMKTYGFVYTGKDKNIHLTQAGKMLVDSIRPKEIFLKQLIKWQYPSFQHKGNQYPETNWHIRPFIFFLKVLNELEKIGSPGLSKIELAIFLLICTKESNLDYVITEIIEYRNNIKSCTNSLSREELTDKIFFERYKQAFGDINTVREGKSENNNYSAIRTKMRNARDVADSTFRYFSYTGLLSSQGNKLVLNPERLDEIIEIIELDYFNQNYNDVTLFHKEFGNPSFPYLSTDNITTLKDKINECHTSNLNIINLIEKDFPNIQNDINYLETLSLTMLTNDVEELKNILYKERELNLELKKKKLQIEFKNPKKVQELIDLLSLYYEKSSVLIEIMSSKFIANKNTVLEYLALNGFIALGSALIYKNNYTIDASLQPISHAAGNQSDIEIEFEDFIILGEVTTSKGKTQYSMEGEPVTRHFKNKLLELNATKELFCVFIAPSINSNTIDEFSMFNLNDGFHIAPITINQFIAILKTKKIMLEKNLTFSANHLKSLLNDIVAETLKFNPNISDINSASKIVLKNIDSVINNWCKNLL